MSELANEGHSASRTTTSATAPASPPSPTGSSTPGPNCTAIPPTIELTAPMGVDLNPRLDLMDDGELATTKSRTEVAKLTYELDQQRSWRWSLLFSSIVAPFGSVILLLLGWYGSHVAERRQQTEDIYSRSAKELSSRDPSVRLGAVKTLEHSISDSESTLAGRIAESLFTSKTSRELAEVRSRETMAFWSEPWSEKTIRQCFKPSPTQPRNIRRNQPSQPYR